MTTPNIVPIEYNATSTDYLKVKTDRSGAARVYGEQVTVPVGTASGTIVGLVPFTKGFRIEEKTIGAFSGALGTGVTASLGVIYDDNTNNTNNQTLYASGLTAPAAGGELVAVASAANLSYVTTAQGWLAATTGGTTSSTAAALNISLLGSYDGLGINNSNEQN